MLTLLARIQGDLQLRINTGSDSLIVHLERYYANFTASPSGLTEVVEDAVRGVVVLATDERTEPLISCVTPVIKSRRWLQSVREQVCSAGADEIAWIRDAEASYGGSP